MAYVSPDTALLVLGWGTRATLTWTLPGLPQLVGLAFHQCDGGARPAVGNGTSAMMSGATAAIIGR